MLSDGYHQERAALRPDREPEASQPAEPPYPDGPSRERQPPAVHLDALAEYTSFGPERPMAPGSGQLGEAA